MITNPFFAVIEAAKAANCPMRVFDWDRAYKVIQKAGPKRTYQAGLAEDLDYTIGTIWKDDKPVEESHAYLCSKWATPILILDDEELECWLFDYESKYTDEDCLWPNL